MICNDVKDHWTGSSKWTVQKNRVAERSWTSITNAMTRSRICPMRCQETGSRCEEVSRYWLRSFLFILWKQEDCLYEAFNLTHFLFWRVFKSTFTGELIVYFNYSIWFQTWTCIINNNTLLALFRIHIVLEKYKIIIYNIEYMAMMVNWFI